MIVIVSLISPEKCVLFWGRYLSQAVTTHAVLRCLPEIIALSSQTCLGSYVNGVHVCSGTEAHTLTMHIHVCTLTDTHAMHTHLTHILCAPLAMSTTLSQTLAWCICANTHTRTSTHAHKHTSTHAHTLMPRSCTPFFSLQEGS